jgi:hypothetical protein
MLRQDLDRLLEDTTMLTIAFAIALGWSVYELARGVAIFIDGLTVHLPAPDANGFSSGYGSGGGMSWVVGRHVISLDGILVGLLQLVFVLAIAAYVRSRTSD